MTAQIPGPSGEQISALEMLAGGPNGCSETELKAKGFTIGLLGGLIRAGLATATPWIVETDGRALDVVRLAITENRRGRAGPSPLSGLLVGRGGQSGTWIVDAHPIISSSAARPCFVSTSRPPASRSTRCPFCPQEWAFAPERAAKSNAY